MARELETYEEFVRMRSSLRFSTRAPAGQTWTHRDSSIGTYVDSYFECESSWVERCFPSKSKPASKQASKRASTASSYSRWNKG